MRNFVKYFQEVIDSHNKEITLFYSIINIIKEQMKQIEQAGLYMSYDPHFSSFQLK